MKKILTFGSMLLLASTSVFATQSRLLALGMSETDNDGMYNVDDSRNIFLNPAHINTYYNQVVFEYGASGQNASVLGTSSSTTINNNTYAPKAQGGFFRKQGEYVYGLYVGNESNTSSLIRSAGASAISALNGITNTTTYADTNSKMLQSADNQLDFFFGGGSDLKWGTNLLFANSKDDARKAKDTSLAIRGGLLASNWEGHLNLSLASKAEATDSVTAPGLGIGATDIKSEVKGKFGVQIGGAYNLPVGKVYGWAKRYSWDQSDSYNGYGALGNAVGGQNGTVAGDFTSFFVGYGRDFAVNNGDKIYTSITAKQTSINLAFSNKSEVRHLVIPLTFSYEMKATDWLTLRGSVVQNIYGQKDNKNITNTGATGTKINAVARGLISKIYGNSGKGTIDNSTAVNAGATLVFGNLSIDGLLGITSSTGSSVTSATDTNPPKKGVLSLANLETSVGVTYKF